MDNIKLKNMIIVIVFTITIIVLLTIVQNNLNEKNENNNDNNSIDNSNSENVTQIDKNDVNVINEIKSQINATADTDMYQVETEYDGRPTIQIKPNIQYDTVLAGILKNGSPNIDEITNILENKPKNKGIWISKQSTQDFLKLLNENQISNYYIDEQGYLKKNENSETNSSFENIQNLDNAINSNNLYIIDISGKCYVRDDLSGEVVEYPFERMDPYQVLEPYKYEDSLILEITTNSKNELSNEEILKTILLNLQM